MKKDFEKIYYLENLNVCRVLPKQLKFNLPVIFIHGAWGSKLYFSNWMRFCRSCGIASYAPDLPGHGKSPGDLKAFSISSYADAISSLINRIGPCCVVGHSMGGLIAQVAASKNSLVKKAAFVASAPPAGIIFVNPFILHMTKYLKSILFFKPFRISCQDALSFLYTNASCKNYGLLHPESGRALYDIGIWNVRIDHLLCPTLVLGAEEDRVIPIWVNNKIAQKYGSEFIILPKTGHVVMLEKKWKLAISLIIKWLCE